MTCDHRVPLLLPEDAARCPQCWRRFKLNCLAMIVIGMAIILAVWK